MQTIIKRTAGEKSRERVERNVDNESMKRNERESGRTEQQPLSVSHRSWLTLGSVRPSVKGSHAKWMATGSKRFLHVKRSLRARLLQTSKPQLA